MSKKPTNKWLAITVISVGTISATLNASIINIANPILASDFGVSMTQIQWVVTIYLIIMSSLMLLFGRLGDRFGAHRIYIVGLATFTVGTLCCALSNSLITLLLARVLQGIGGSMTVAMGMGLVTTIFPIEQRGRAIGINVLMVGLGNVAGPAVGGFILAFASWHAVFLLSVPFSFLAFIIAALWLRSPLPRQKDVSLDLGGSILFAATIASLILFLSGGFAGQEWFGLVFVALLITFIFVERRVKSPLIEPALLKNRRFLLGNLIAFFTYCAYMMMQFQLPFFLKTVWNTPVGTVGLLIMVGALCLAIWGPISGILTDRFGASLIMPLGLFLVLICMLLALFLSAEVNIVLLVVVLVLAGTGNGLMNTPNNSEIMTAAGREYASFASGFVGTNRSLAFCLGTALSASTFTFAMTLPGRFPSLLSAFVADAILGHVFSLRAVLMVGAMFVIVSIVICLYLIYGKKD